MTVCDPRARVIRRRRRRRREAEERGRRGKCSHERENQGIDRRVRGKSRSGGRSRAKQAQDFAPTNLPLFSSSLFPLPKGIGRRKQERKYFPGILLLLLLCTAARLTCSGADCFVGGSGSGAEGGGGEGESEAGAGAHGSNRYSSRESRRASEGERHAAALAVHVSCTGRGEQRLRLSACIP